MAWLKRGMVVLGALAVSLGAALASPVGQWEIESGDSRYQVSMCGDGTQLCAELIWLGNGADSRKNLPYLNTLMIDGAKQVKPNQWKGQLNLYGQSAPGTITQVSADVVRIRGCFLLVVCRSYNLKRIGD
ncbi:MAG: hypothetical protein JWR39_2598 [Devosia sp.]|nr:hypothetical protein [Devosia sp.]